MTDEVLPELHTFLTDHREEIVNQVIDAMKKVFAELALKVAEKGIKNLSNERPGKSQRASGYG